MSIFTKVWNWDKENRKPLNDFNMDAVFSPYSTTGESPLVMALKQKAQADAIANFNANRRSPGMAEEPIPGVEPTFVPRPDVSGGLQPRPWLVSMQGEGPRFQQEPASMQTWIKKQSALEMQFSREQKMIEKLISENPIEFTGRSVETFANKKEAEAYLKFQRELKIKAGKLGETKTHNRTMEEIAKEKAGIGGFGPNVSTGTVKGGGVAPTLSPQDKAAFDWARQNPKDPRATGILLKLKQKGL